MEFRLALITLEQRSGELRHGALVHATVERAAGDEAAGLVSIQNLRHRPCRRRARIRDSGSTYLLRNA